MAQAPGRSAEGLGAAPGQEGAARGRAEAPDRKWLAGLPLWDALSDNRAGFIREAMFWKHAQPLLDQIRRAFPGLDEESPERIGTHRTQLVSTCSTAHPRRWELCFQCKGTGVSNDPRDPRCSWCRGEGFEITKRNWGDPHRRRVIRGVDARGPGVRSVASGPDPVNRRWAAPGPIPAKFSRIFHGSRKTHS